MIPSDDRRFLEELPVAGFFYGRTRNEGALLLTAMPELTREDIVANDVTGDRVRVGEELRLEADAGVQHLRSCYNSLVPLGAEVIIFSAYRILSNKLHISFRTG